MYPKRGTNNLSRSGVQRTQTLHLRRWQTLGLPWEEELVGHQSARTLVLDVAKRKVDSELTETSTVLKIDLDLCIQSFCSSSGIKCLDTSIEVILIQERDRAPLPLTGRRSMALQARGNELGFCIAQVKPS